MPRLTASKLFQFAVLWPAIGKYDSNAQPKLGSPVVINCRWIPTKINQLDPELNDINLNEMVQVNQYVPPKSQMWLDVYAPRGGLAADPSWQGALLDWQNIGSLQVPSQLCEVKESDNVPDMKAQFWFRAVKLMRVADSGAI